MHAETRVAERATVTCEESGEGGAGCFVDDAPGPLDVRGGFPPGYFTAPAVMPDFQ